MSSVPLTSTLESSLVAYSQQGNSSSEKKDSPPLRRHPISQKFPLKISIGTEIYSPASASSANPEYSRSHLSLRQVKSLPSKRSPPQERKANRLSPSQDRKDITSTSHHSFSKSLGTVHRAHSVAKVLRRSQMNEQEQMYRELIEGTQIVLGRLIKELNQATLSNNFPLQMKRGREIQSVFNHLDSYLNDINIRDFEEFEREIKSLIDNTQSQTDYLTFLDDLSDIHDLKNNPEKRANNENIRYAIERKSREITETTDLSTQIDLQKRKGQYIEALLLRAIDECHKTRESLVNPLTQHFLVKLKEKIDLLSKQAKDVEAPEEFQDYFARIFKAASVGILASQHSPKTPPLDELPSSEAIDSLMGVLESETLHLQQVKAEIFIAKTAELLKIRNVLHEALIEGNLKITVTSDRSSIETTPRTGLLSFRAGTSPDAHETIAFILDTIGSSSEHNTKTKQLGLEILDLLEKNEWVAAVLKHSSRGELGYYKDEIKADLTNWQQIADKAQKQKEQRRAVTAASWAPPAPYEDVHHNLWNLLLEPPADLVFQKYFLLIYRNLINTLNRDGKTPSEKLFNIFNRKFIAAGPFQRKQILLMTSEWLRNPSLYIKTTRDSEKGEFGSTVREIQELLKKARETRALALAPLVDKISNQLEGYLQPLRQPPNFSEAVSPLAMLDMVAHKEHRENYTTYVSNFSEALRQISFYHFSQINSFEWEQKNFNAETAPHLRAMIDFSTNLTNWIVQTLVNSKELKCRKRLMEFFIDVESNLAEELTGSSTTPIDFVSALAIHSVFQKVYIEKLIASDKQELHLSETHLEILKRHAELFQVERNFKNLRQKSEDLPFYIPAISLFLSDLTKVFDKDINPLMVEESINLGAIESIGKILAPLSEQQSVTAYSSKKVAYHFDEEFLEMLQNNDYHTKKAGGFDQNEFDSIMSKKSKATRSL